MTVSAAILPKQSALWAHFRPGDFIDCYCATDVDDQLDLETAVRKGIGHMPKWVSLLMDMRNRIVGPLGLKAGRHSLWRGAEDGRALALEKDGERLVFTVQERYENEMILGEDDRHLNFRVSVLRDGSTWYVATWVHPNAWYGWVYLYTILPFHKLIMRLSAKRLEAVAG